ncbi:MAG: PAAR domain-containing protein [Gammaproteobacteria bacterium]
MRRYSITLGASTTVGGKVISASGDLVNGVPMALEGDLVSCPVCRSNGKIVCVEPRIPETWNGRPIALENDVCNCRCSPLPRLLANQTARSQVLKDTGQALSQPVERCARPARPGSAAGPREFSGRFVLVDAHSGIPLAHREYAVVRQSGQLEFGRLDAAGQTHLLHTTIHAESVDVYLCAGPAWRGLGAGPVQVTGSASLSVADPLGGGQLGAGLLGTAPLSTALISPCGAVLLHQGRSTTGTAAEGFVKVVLVRLPVPQAPRSAGERAAVAEPATAPPAGHEELVVLDAAGPTSSALRRR